jgi:carbon-monoxide dehydrogenase large subunit
MSEMMGGGARFVGQRVARKEDARFLTGHGRYVDDIDQPGTLHAAFVRSDVARGRIESIDVTAAEAIPGVHAVYVAADLAPLVHDYLVDDEHDASRPWRILADGDVRCVGEPIAVVIADSRYVAEDGVAAVVVEVEAEAPLVDYAEASADGALLVHPDRDSNVLTAMPAMDNPELEAALESAPVVMTETFRQHRYATVPMETRGILADWDRYRDELTVWLSTQGPHGARSLFARLLGIDDSRVRVIMPDVGGSFGLKMNARSEEIAAVLASFILGRPVKWIQDRHENLLADDHPREDLATVTMATDEEGHILAEKAHFVESLGAFPAALSSASILSTMIFPGPYRVPLFGASAQAVLTNLMGRGSYRGPWMFETVAREQMMDCMAARLEIDPLEFRRRNVVRAEELPYSMATGVAFDQITAAETLEQAAEVIGYERWRRDQEVARVEGRLLGIGMSLMAEPTAMAFGWMSSDAATVRIGRNGKVDVYASTASHGQSYETTIAQVVADELGVDLENVRVIQGGDTAATPLGPGTGGSRSMIPITAARTASHELRARIVAIVAKALEACEEDLELIGGRVQVVGTPTQGLSIAEVAAIAYTQPAALPDGIPIGLEAQSRFSPNTFTTWSNACHMCALEIDRDTGAVTILRYVVSEDCGVMINPNVVEGQIAGGVVQGIGGVLYEHLKYDESGNPLTTTFLDYLLPTATEVPDIEYAHIETPAPTNPGGHKGLGEGGAIGAPPAVINAVADALRPLGVQIRSQPLGPADIVALMEEAGASAPA